jgi:hypothetical protein
MQLDDCDGQGGTVCPFDSLASLFNDPTNHYYNACVVQNQADESGCYVPEPGMEMVARRCFDINPNAVMSEYVPNPALMETENSNREVEHLIQQLSLLS